MGQMFYLPKYEMQHEGQTLRVDHFEWAELTLDYDQFAEYELDMDEHAEYIDNLIAQGKFINLEEKETMQNGDECSCFIFPTAPAEMIPIHTLLQKWFDLFAQDPNTTVNGPLYLYLRDT